MPHLLDPIQIGDLHLPNRVIMAPLTRLRGTPDHLPTPVMVDYYRQRAGAGMIISEGTPVSPPGRRLRAGSGHLVARAGRTLEARHRGRASGRADAFSRKSGTSAGSAIPVS